MPTTEELFPGAYLIHGEVGGRPLLLPLLIGENTAILLDTGCATDVDDLIVPALNEIGISLDNLTHIIVTHCDLDHQGGNAGLKHKSPQARIGCGAEDAEQVSDPAVIFAQRYDAYRAKHNHYYDDEVRKWIMDSLGVAQAMDVLYTGGETISLSPDWSVQILKLPGHSRGHLAVWDEKHQALFAGDAIHGDIYLSLDGKPALCPTYLYVRPYLQTIRQIEQLQPQLYSGCHWPVYRGDEITDFCRRSRRFVELAEAGIIEAVKASTNGVTLTQLCFAVGPTLGNWPQAVNHELCYAFNGHLEDLVERGLLREETDSFPFRYTLAK